MISRNWSYSHVTLRSSNGISAGQVTGSIPGSSTTARCFTARQKRSLAPGVDQVVAVGVQCPPTVVEDRFVEVLVTSVGEFEDAVRDFDRDEHCPRVGVAADEMRIHEPGVYALRECSHAGMDLIDDRRRVAPAHPQFCCAGVLAVVGNV